MQVYDTLRAGVIQDVRVGRSAVTPATPTTRTQPAVNTLLANRSNTDAAAAHSKKLAEIAADDSLSVNDKRDAVQAENESYAKAVATKDFHPDHDADHRDRLNAIAADQTLSVQQRNEKITAENERFNGPSRSDADYGHRDRLDAIKVDTSLPDDQKKLALDKENANRAGSNDRVGTDDRGNAQDIIHLTLAGGEKRSILRENIVFHNAVLGRGPLNNYPGYAQRAPSVSRGQFAPSGQYLPNGQVMAEQVPRDGSEVAMRGQVPANAGATATGQNVGYGNQPANYTDNRTGQLPGNRVGGQNVGMNNPGTTGQNDSANNIFPVVGDCLVEYFDPVTDVFVQKIYDAATFARYFKASLN